MKVSLSSLFFVSCVLLNTNNAFGFGGSAFGCVSGNCVDGFGEYRYRSGDSYTGFWKSGIRYGRGTYRFADGSRFIGSYANDQRHGPGKYTNVDGQEIRGSWVEGRFVNPKRLESIATPRKSVFTASAVNVAKVNTTKLSVTEPVKLDELLYDKKLTPDEKAALQSEAMLLIRACTGYTDETIKELSYVHSVRRSDFDELYFKLRAYNAGSYQRVAGVLEIVLKLKKYHSGVYEQGIDVGRYYWGDCKESA